jgi:hypothetical protein
MKGSMNMSYDSSNLTTPDIKWLGVRPSDLDRFDIPQQCRLPMTEEDIKTGRKLVGSWGYWGGGLVGPALLAWGAAEGADGLRGGLPVCRALPGWLALHIAEAAAACASARSL